MLLETLAAHLGRRLLILVMMAAIQPAASSLYFPNAIPSQVDSNITGAKPGCPTQCGNLTIPYPFGIHDGCSMNKQFLITCNYSYNPPRAFLDYDTAFISFPHSFLKQHIEVLSISASEVAIRNSPTVLCYDSRGNVTTNYTPWWIINEPYRFPTTNICSLSSVVITMGPLGQRLWKATGAADAANVLCHGLTISLISVHHLVLPNCAKSAL